MSHVPTLAELRETALLWWPEEIRKEVSSSSFKHAMMATFPLFQEIVRESDSIHSLIDNIRDFNNSNQLPANMFLRHCMLFADIGWESMKKWFGETYEEMFPNGKFASQNFEFKMPRLTQSKIRTSSSHIKKSFDYKLKVDNLEQIIAAIRLLFLGSDSSMIQLGKCNLAIYLEDDDGSLFRSDAMTKYIHVSKQTSGAEATSSGDLLEKRIAINPVTDFLNHHYPELNVFQCQNYAFNDEQEMVSDCWFVNSDNGYSVAVEVSFQETTNSVIERKRKDAENRRNLFPPECKSAFVIDGVGSIDHRPKAVEEILNNADIVVSAREDEILRLAKYIGDWLSQKN